MRLPSVEKVVRIAGLEPARLTALPPQSSVSANSTICATGGVMKQHRILAASRFSVCWTQGGRCRVTSRLSRCSTLNVHSLLPMVPDTMALDDILLEAEEKMIKTEEVV